MSNETILEAERIGIIKGDRIGDLVLLSGYLNLLADRLPRATIDVHVMSDLVSLGPLMHRRVNLKTIPFSRQLDATDEELASWLWDIDQMHYDCLVLPRFTLGEVDVLALRYLGTEPRYGFPNFENSFPEDWLTFRLGPAKRDLAQSLVGPEVSPWSHETRKYQQLAVWQGLQPGDRELDPVLYIDDERINPRRRRAGTLVWPGASEPRKCWPPDRFASLVELLEEAEGPVVVGGTPGESEVVDAVAEQLESTTGVERWICDTADLTSTFRRIMKHRLVIANDTGIAHLAAAAGTRVISISSAVHDGRFLLRSRKATTVVAEAPCRRCRGACLFDEPVWPCVTEITPESIVASLESRSSRPQRLGVPAERFAEDSRQLFEQAVQHGTAVADEQHRRAAQLVYDRKVAEDLRRRAEHRATEVESQIAVIEDELEQLRESLDAARSEALALQASEAKLQEELPRLSASIRQATDDLRVAREQLDEARTERDERERELGRLRSDVAELRTARSAAEAEREAHAEHLSDLREALAQSERRRHELADQLARAEADWKHADSELAKAAEKRRGLREEIGRQQSAVAALEGKLKQAAAEHEQLRAEHAKRGEEVDWLRFELERVRSESEEHNAARREAINELDRTTRERDRAIDRARELELDNDAVKRWAASHIDANYAPAPDRHTWLGPPALPGDLPRISIVTPSYNTGPYIAATIESILEQDYPNFEHIVLDACSSDGTTDICARYTHLKWVIERDRGQTHAINRGLMLSTGEIVAYLNSDDVYRPGAFYRVAKYFADNPDCMILVGDCDLIDEDDEIIGHWTAKAGRWVDRVRYWGWEQTHCIPQQGIFMRRELLTRIGLFDARLKMVMDLDMWLRATREHELGVIPETLAAFRMMEGTKTISRTHEMYIEQLMICRRHARHLPWLERATTDLGARRHFANLMLNITEHYLFNADQRKLPLQLLGRGMAEWPLLALNPRAWMTLGQGLTRQTPLWPLVAKPHRAYLGLIWRLREARRGARANPR
jgi:glycosyltransferase involved in cell wall biosynthesis/ADP-heptose:LPS heptosyltransferase